MTPRALARLLLGYVALIAILCVVARRAASLREVDGETIATGWRSGEMVARAVDSSVAQVPGVVITKEKVVGEGALDAAFEPVFSLSVVSGLDGVKATWNGATLYLTSDELLAHQAYDKGITIQDLSLSFGLDVQLVEALFAQRFRTTVPELRAHAVFRRIRTKRVAGIVKQDSAGTKPDDVNPKLLKDAALAAAGFLARGVGPDGRFRYTVDAATNRTLPGYDWPRHAGAAYFLAQAAELAPDPMMRDAALRSVRYLRDKATVDCGGMKCVGSEPLIDIGSASLAVIAMVEVARTGLDPSFRGPVEELTRFIRSLQRPDGEFMHLFDRRTGKPIDTQFIYYSGEATVALARAHELTGDPADLEAARRGLAHLVGPAWSFFGSRYYFGEEHWTCQATGELWERAPDPVALDFCERWREYDAHMMYGPGDTPWDADGAFGVGPLITPRLTPVASRTEAGVATLDAMIKANVDPARRAALTSQLRRSFALLLRQQLRPGPFYLFADVDGVFGAMPGSCVDWQLRIDYTQHTGSAIVRALSLWSR